MQSEEHVEIPAEIVDTPPPTIETIRTSAEVAQLYAALAAAQAEMTDPPKNKTATVKTRSGESYTYKYSDLADLKKITRPVYGKHGLVLLQMPTNRHRGAVTIVNRIAHKSGQWMQFELTMLVGDEKPQTMGSAITYGRRYSEAGIAGIAPDEDDDGNQAQRAAGDKEAQKGQDRRNQANQQRPADRQPPKDDKPKEQKPTDKLFSKKGVKLSFSQDGLLTMLNEAEGSAPDGIYDASKDGHKKLLGALCQMEDVTAGADMGRISSLAMAEQVALTRLDEFTFAAIRGGKHLAPAQS